MAKPCFRRFWVIVRPDGSAEPQFDPITGKSREIGVDLGPVAQILFFPITPVLAEKIRANGDEAEASNFPVLTFMVPPGKPVKFHRLGDVRLDPVQVCGFCKAVFDDSAEECPRCLAKVSYYCGKCDSLKMEPLVDFVIQNRGRLKKKIRIVNALHRYAWKVIENIPGGWQLVDAQLRCPDCEATMPRGLKTIPCIQHALDERIFIYYHLELDGIKHIILDYKLNKV